MAISGLRCPIQGITAIVSVSLGIGFATALVEIPMWQTTPWLALANICTAAVAVAVGQMLRKDREQRGTGLLLTLAGVAHSLGWLGTWNFGPFPLYETVFGELDDIFGVWALLRYPDARLGPYRRLYVRILGTWLIGGRFLLAAVSRPSYYPGISPSAWWPTMYPDSRVYVVGTSILYVGIICLIAAAVVLFLARLRAHGQLLRRARVPAATMGIVAAVAAATATVLAMLHLTLPPFFCVEAVGSGFMIPLTVAWIGWWQEKSSRNIMREIPQIDSIHAIQELLRRELGTRSLRIIYRDVEEGRYVDGSGLPAELPTSSRDFLIRRIDGRMSAESTAYVVVDTDVARRYPRLLEDALAALRVALDSARLKAYRDDQESCRTKLAELTDRQRNALRLIAEYGMTNEQIAAKLSWSVKQIEADLTGIYKSFGVRKRGQAALIWDRAHHVPQQGNLLIPASDISDEKQSIDPLAN